MENSWIYNPETNRYVIRTGLIGQRLLKAGLGTVNPLDIHPISSRRKIGTVAKLDVFNIEDLKDIEKQVRYEIYTRGLKADQQNGIMPIPTRPTAAVIEPTEIEPVAMPRPRGRPKGGHSAALAEFKKQSEVASKPLSKPVIPPKVAETKKIVIKKKPKIVARVMTDQDSALDTSGDTGYSSASEEEGSDVSSC